MHSTTTKSTCGKLVALITMMCVAIVSLPSFADAKSVTLSCSGYAGSTTLTDFQALIKLSNGAYGFHYSDCIGADGTDLWFTDSSGNLISHEVDTWDTSGDSFVWVKIPTVTPVAEHLTEITMHWGEARTAAQTCTSSSTWSNFVGVWHMGKANGSANEPDVTGNGLDAKPTAGSSGAVSQMTTAPGLIGGCRINQTSSSKHNGLKVPAYADKMADTNEFSVGGWWYADQRATSFAQRYFCTRNASSSAYVVGWDVMMGQNVTPDDIRFVSQYTSGNGNAEVVANYPISDIVGRWMYMYMTCDNNTIKIYIDGELVCSGTPAQTFRPVNLTYGMMIGNLGVRGQGWIGKYDELRMYDGVMSSDRIKADYDTTHSPLSFLTAVGAVVSAEWTGSAGDGSVTNSANWTCRDVLGNIMPNALPTADTTVTIESGALYIQAGTNTVFSCASLRLGNCTLSADSDLSGFGTLSFADNNTCVDLNGHDLRVTWFDNPGIVTNGVSGIAALRVWSPAGVTNVNLGVTIGGHVRFVKEGEGGFKAAKAYQTYTGGNHVSEGTLVCGYAQKYDPLGLTNLVNEIVVSSNGVFDVDGQFAWSRWKMVLDGGIVQNSGAEANPPAAQIGSMRLEADSWMLCTSSYGILAADTVTSYVNLNGYTLHAVVEDGKSFNFASIVAENGTISIDGGTFRVGGHSLVNGITNVATNVNFIVNSAMNISAPLNVGGYEALYDGSINTGAALLKVHGTFKPSAHDCFHGCEMQDGSTMDLSSRSNALPLVSAFTTGDNKLKFANGATVSVKLGERPVSSRKPIISWDSASKPTGIDTVKFVSATGERKRSFVAQDDGLYALSGLIIIVK